MSNQPKLGPRLIASLLGTAGLLGVMMLAPDFSHPVSQPVHPPLLLSAATLDAVEFTAPSPDKVLDPNGDVIPISGSGFDPAYPGLYVAFGPANLGRNFYSDPGKFSSLVWVREGGAGKPGQAELKPDGSFKLNLPVRPIPGVSEYAIYIFRALGSTDRSQDNIDAGYTFAPKPQPPTRVIKQDPPRKSTAWDKPKQRPRKNLPGTVLGARF